MKNMMKIVLKNGFQSARVNVNRDRDGGKEAPVVENCSIII